MFLRSRHPVAERMADSKPPIVYPISAKRHIRIIITNVGIRRYVLALVIVEVVLQKSLQMYNNLQRFPNNYSKILNFCTAFVFFA